MNARYTNMGGRLSLNFSQVISKVKVCDDDLVVGVANLSARTSNESCNPSSKCEDSETEDS